MITARMYNFIIFIIVPLLFSIFNSPVQRKKCLCWVISHICIISFTSWSLVWNGSQLAQILWNPVTVDFMSRTRLFHRLYTISSIVTYFSTDLFLSSVINMSGHFHWWQLCDHSSVVKYCFHVVLQRDLCF